MATNKKLIWIGIGSALLIGGGMFWWWKNKNSVNNTDTNNTSDESKKTVDKSEPIVSNPILIKDKSVNPTGNNTKPTPKDEVVGLKVGNPVFLKGVDTTTIYSYPEFKGEYIIGSISKSWLLDKAFGKIISDAGNGWYKIETFAFVPKCPPNARCTNQPQVNKVTAYINKQFVSNKPY
jgi:hypothetical protein